MRYKWLILGLVVLGVGLLFWPVDVRRATPSPTLLAADGTLLRAFPAVDGQLRLPVTLQQVDPEFIRLLKAIEDRRYNWHPGFDPFALLRATYQWLHTGTVVSGGSTLTMQVARLLSPAPRTLPHKIAEIWRAMRLTVQYNKEDILNFYLQLAPYGGNIAGVRTAALTYFAKEPKRLTPDETALLIALPQNPNHFRPDRFPKQAERARAIILQRLMNKKVITETAYKAGVATPVPQTRFPLAAHAFHLADHLYGTHLHTSPWRSTIDAALQIRIETLLQQQAKQLSGITTIAALVVDNKTHTVVAYIGNADYFDQDKAGNVDLIPAIRSPGSTLKPFVYGMAFQDGLATPDTIIRDEQTHFGSYSPSNFDQGYHGEVTLRTALQQSFNIPAVKLLSQVGPERWLATLRSTGAHFSLPDKKATAELPIILGGLGTSLWDLTTLYVGLANNGQVHPLSILKSQTSAFTHPVLTPSATAQVTDILIESPLGVVRGAGLTQLAVKTGTSYGYRDAWAMGYSPRYTIGVWVGRADGSTVPDQAGRKTAVPILLSIYQLLPFSPQDHFKTVAPKQGNNPVQLQYWLGDRVKNLAMTTGNADINSLKISYPINNAKYNLTEINSHGIRLNAEGGSKVYQWYINGMPLPTATQQATYWQPTTMGFYKITLQDDEGHTTEHHVMIE